MPEAVIQNPTAPEKTVEAAPAVPDTGWQASIPDQYKAEKFWGDYKDKGLDAVLKTTIEAQKVIGRSIQLPDEKADPKVRDEAMGKIYTKLGRPEKSDGYTIAATTLLPDGLEWDKDQIKGFSEHAHKLGLSQSQFDGVMKFYSGTLKTYDQVKAQKETREVLEKEWGENGFKVKTAEGYAAARILLGESADKWLSTVREGAPGDDEVVMRLLARVGRDMREDGIIDDTIVEGSKSTADLEAEAKKIIADPEDPYNKPRHPLHKERVKHVTHLFEMSTM